MARGREGARARGRDGWVGEEQEDADTCIYLKYT
jgi:hypothetical protein